jgi:hypothetical protein
MTATVPRGQAVSFAVAVSGTGGFTGRVSLAVSGLPSGMRGTWSAKIVQVPGSSTLLVKATRSVVRKTYTIVISGTKGAVKHKVAVTVTVT